jgi:hypothetical protein
VSIKFDGALQAGRFAVEHEGFLAAMLEQETLDAGAEVGIGSAGGVEVLGSLGGAFPLNCFDE